MSATAAHCNMVQYFIFKIIFDRMNIFTFIHHRGSQQSITKRTRIDTIQKLKEENILQQQASIR